jgi:outer membrane protein assembly factor BamB
MRRLNKYMKKSAVFFLCLILLFSLVYCKGKTTKPLWEIKTGDQVSSIYFTAENRLYAASGEYLEFGSPTKNLLCIDIKNGNIIWKKKLGNTFFIKSVSHSKGKLYIFNLEQTKPVILDAKTGAAVEDASLPIPAKMALIKSYKGMPVLASGGNVEKGIGKMIYCKNISSNKIIWSYSFMGMKNIKNTEKVNFDYFVDKDVLYIGKYNGSIAAVKILS